MTNELAAPTCVGIIMDGNRRWARKRGLPAVMGHAKGRDVFRKCVGWAKEAGVQYLVFYAFSTENWKRSPEEVEGLMQLFEETLKRELPNFLKDNVRLRFVGDRSLFLPHLQEQMRLAEEQTAQGTEGTVVLALSYGGRAEIVAAANELLRNGAREATEEMLARALWSHDIPDPDLIIRTGGEKRLSNFLTWQSVYSELFFLDELWPDFSQESFTKVLEEFNARKRNFGK